MERYISVDNIESIKIYKRFEDRCEDVVKIHSKGEDRWLPKMFKMKYKSDIYYDHFGLCEITKEEILKHTRNLEFDVRGICYYKPHVSIKYFNGDVYTKYFENNEKLTEFIKTLRDDLVNCNKNFIFLNF